jgi:hypothetical protein
LLPHRDLPLTVSMTTSSGTWPHVAQQFVSIEGTS